MENVDLINSFSEFSDDKMIDRVTLMSIIDESFRPILSKRYGSSDNFDIIVNPDKGDIAIYRNRLVVDDGDVTDNTLEISLSSARKIESDFEIGEDVSEEVKLSELGRRAILSLRQNISSKIREYDNTSKYKHFEDLIGELYTAEVHHVKYNVTILVDSDDNELILPKSHKIPSDYFRKGDIISGVIEEVKIERNKTVVVLSRTSPKFIERLFEQEIPEVSDGIIEVRKVVRIPGVKAKVTVDSYDDRIDPVGSCVGMRGSRINNITREIGNEGIDVIHHTNSLELLITRSLNPARVLSMTVNEENKTVVAVLESSELSKAIGRGGSNIRLASDLVGYKIDVIAEGQEEDVELIEFNDEIEQWIIDEFTKVGLDTAKSVLECDIDDLVERVDLEEETIKEVISVLESEFS